VGREHHSDGATEGNQRTWHADEWRQAEGVAGVGDTLALSAGSVRTASTKLLGRRNPSELLDDRTLASVGTINA
jgi:hypothetical protein